MKLTNSHEGNSTSGYRFLKKYLVLACGVLISIFDNASEIWVWNITTTCLQITSNIVHHDPRNMINFKILGGQSGNNTFKDH